VLRRSLNVVDNFKGEKNLSREEGNTMFENQSLRPLKEHAVSRVSKKKKKKKKKIF